MTELLCICEQRSGAIAPCDVESRPEGPPATNQVRRWTGITIYRFDGTGKIIAKVGEESEPVPVERVDSGNGGRDERAH